MTTKKQCKAKASATGDQCKRKAVADGYCKQHYNQTHPQVNEEEVRASLDVVEADAPQATYQVDLVQANPAFQKFEIAKRVAHTLAQSNLVPDAYRGRPNDCFVAINMGAELGMEPFQAIQSIAVIDGKPCLYGDGLIGVVRASSKCEWIEEEVAPDGKSATCRTQRKGDRNPIERTYSMTDAMLAGIDSKANWRKHPKRMLQMRARAYCLRDAYPDLLKGLGMVEELIDHDDSPPPIVSYDLPQKQTIAEAAEAAANPPTAAGVASALLDQAKEVFGDGVHVVTFETVERAMHQSDSMEDLLAAAKDAKHLDPEDQAKLRGTYKQMRDAILDTGEASGQ
jgi:hypothetical protein